LKKRKKLFLNLTFGIFSNRDPIKYHNIIATIPGEDIADEYVVLGAHLDSYDIATGAVDNGSGVSPMMEAVRLLMKAGAKPKRSIMLQTFCQ